MKTINIQYQEHDRKRAIRDVLAVLRCVTMHHADREVAYALVQHHQLLAVDLLDMAVLHSRESAETAPHENPHTKPPPDRKWRPADHRWVDGTTRRCGVRACTNSEHYK